MSCYFCTDRGGFLGVSKFFKFEGESFSENIIENKSSKKQKDFKCLVFDRFGIEEGEGKHFLDWLKPNWYL